MIWVAAGALLVSLGGAVVAAFSLRESRRANRAVAHARRAHFVIQGEYPARLKDGSEQISFTLMNVGGSTALRVVASVIDRGRREHRSAGPAVAIAAGETGTIYLLMPAGTLTALPKNGARDTVVRGNGARLRVRYADREGPTTQELAVIDQDDRGNPTG